jgi:hypothetical protein
MGTAMAAGLAVVNTHRMQMDGEWEMAEAHQAAHAAFDEELLAFQNAGGVVSLDQWDRLPALIERALDYYTLHDPVPVTWLIKGVEYEFPDLGNMRPDLIVQDNEGLAPVDYKMTESLYVRSGETREQARARKMTEYCDHWNMKQYVWGVNQQMGPCNHYYICLGELTPKPCFTLQRFDLSLERREAFELSAFKYWRHMGEIDNGHDIPAEAASHETKYGPCEYAWACQEANRNVELMQHKYVKVERRRESAVKAAE